MHSTLYILGLLSAYAAHSSAGTIGLGKDNGGNKVTWVAPDNPCSRRILLTNADLSPCGIHFSAGNLDDLHYEGCGGAL
jgi:hypothetical protein